MLMSLGQNWPEELLQISVPCETQYRVDSGHRARMAGEEMNGNLPYLHKELTSVF